MNAKTEKAIMAALEFYADEYNYAPNVEDVIGVNPDGTMMFDMSDVDDDCGKRARNALKLIEVGL